MNILFIHPNPKSITKYGKSKSSFFNKVLQRFSIFAPQLVFPMLAAVTPKNHSITIIDERYQTINFEKKYDIVGITAMTFEAARAYEVADEFKKRGTTVVLGGWHASSLPKEAKQHADAVVIGEAEELWPQLLIDYGKGSLKPFYLQEKPVDLDRIPPPNRNVIPGCFLSDGVQASRSCPYGCKFCALSYSRHGRIFRKRPIEEVINDIKITNHKIIIFYDASLTIDIEYTKSLFKKMKSLNKKIICNGNVDVLSKDDELLELSKEAGCIQWNLGFESISQKSLDSVGKKTNKVENYKKAVDKIHKHGMCVLGLFMFGFDTDDVKIFENTLKFLKTSGIDEADFSILTPLPDTEIRKSLLEADRVLTNDWENYNFQKNVVFKPKLLTEEELLNGVHGLYKDFYSIYGIITRSISSIKKGWYPFFLTVIQNISPRFIIKLL